MASKTLSDVCDIVMGQSPAGEMCNTSGVGIPLLNGPTEYGPHHPTPVQFTTDARKFAKAGDLLFCVRGSTTGRMNWADRDYAIGRGVAAIRHKSQRKLQPLVRAVVEFHLPSLLTQATGSTFPNVSSGMLSALPWPDLDEHDQRVAAHILGTLDDKIELNRKQNETLEAMARALFKAWFVDFEPVRAKMEGRWQRDQSLPGLPAHLYDLFPDRLVESELGEIPEGWRVGSVYEVASVRYGAPFASSKFNSEGKGRPLVRIRDLRNERPGVWTEEVHPKGYLIQPGDIVVGMDGEFRAYLWGGEPAWMNQRICVFHPKNPHCAAFVRNAIKPHLARVEATEVATTVIHLGKGDIDEFRIVIPRDNVAREFEKLCQPNFDQIVLTKQQSSKLAQLRDTLLPKLISGELRIADAEAFLKGRG